MKLYAKVFAVLLIAGAIYMLVGLFEFADRTLASLHVRDVFRIVGDIYVIAALVYWARQSWKKIV